MKGLQVVKKNIIKMHVELITLMMHKKKKRNKIVKTEKEENNKIMELIKNVKKI